MFSWNACRAFFGANSTPGINCDGEKPCLANPCQNGAACSNNGNTDYECDCPTGWGGQDCDVDLDPCNPNPCNAFEPAAMCFGSGANYICWCGTDSLYDGANCDNLIGGSQNVSVRF